MKEKVELDWKEEDNAYINKIFRLADLILLFIIIVSPLIASAFCLIGVTIDMPNVLIICFIVYLLIRILSFCLNWRFIKFRKLDVVEILGMALMLMLCVTEIINAPVTGNMILILGFFIVFILFFKLEKKYYKPALYTFILTLVVCSIMGLCDLNNSYMPGFVDITFPMSLQFWNPNYSAYITVMAIFMTIYVLSKYKKLWEQILFWVSYAVLNVCLFINGCFSAETAMFIGEIFLIIYLWVKNKKCPYLVLICLGLSMAASFAWIKGYSTSGANYMFEMLSFLDGKLGTTLTKDVSTFFDKLFGTGIIESVIGSDGWDRGDLKAKAIKAIFASPKSVIFGYGNLYNNNIRVHNVFLQIWLEYGLINLAFYVSIWVIMLVRLFKTNFNSYNIYLLTLIMSVVLVCHYFGCLEVYSYTYFICFVGVFFRGIDDKIKTKKTTFDNNDNKEGFVHKQQIEEMQSQHENLETKENIVSEK